MLSFANGVLPDMHKKLIFNIFPLYPSAIPVYLFKPLKSLYFQGISLVLCLDLMYFPLFLPLRAETREIFVIPADRLIRQSRGGTLRFSCMH